jgi:hypothetical protein
MVILAAFPAKFWVCKSHSQIPRSSLEASVIEQPHLGFTSPITNISLITRHESQKTTIQENILARSSVVGFSLNAELFSVAL